MNLKRIVLFFSLCLILSGCKLGKFSSLSKTDDGGSSGASGGAAAHGSPGASGGGGSSSGGQALTVPPAMPDGLGTLSPGKGDVNICLPQNRDQLGVISFGSVKCYVKGRGNSRDRRVKKGDTPTGMYTIVGLDGNSRGQWGQKGLQLRQTWTGKTNQAGEPGRGIDITNGLFIHTRMRQRRGNVPNAEALKHTSTWGCPLVPKPCMDKLTRWYEQNKSKGQLKVSIQDRGKGC